MTPQVTANRTTTRWETVCEIPQDSMFPHCIHKVDWLRDNWKRFPKFEKAGVNGTVCSFLVYLSQVIYLTRNVVKKFLV